MACQVALLSGAFAEVRVVVRTAAFATSLALLMFLGGPRLATPSARAGGVALAVVGLSILNPGTVGLVAGIADAALYLAILGPIFWVPRISIDLRSFRHVLLALWSFHAVSACFGALQVYFPGEFQPALASGIESDYAESLRITLANGERVFRPMGLTDTPGGVGISGFYSVLLGVGFLLDKTRWWFRLILLFGMFAGMFALYLCQVRSLVVMLVVCVVSIGALLGSQGRLRTLSVSAFALVSVAIGAFVVATSVAGVGVTDRLASLLEDDPGQLYYAHRGMFLESTITDLLPRYPLGAGLGRWGMIFGYFGGNSTEDGGPIWVEIQWTGWLLDGGLPLIVAYVAAIAAALWFAFRVATRRVAAAVDGLWLWGIVLVGYDLGALALTFNYPLFVSSMGLEFWLLNAALFTAASAAPP